MMNSTPFCRLVNRRLLFQSLSNIRFRTTRLPSRATLSSHQLRLSSRYSGSGNGSLSGTHRNPMDDITVDPIVAQKRAKDIRYMKFCGAGIAFGIAAQLIIISLWPAADVSQETTSVKQKKSEWNLIPTSKADAPAKGAEEFQGKPVVVVAGGQKLVAKDERNGKEIELVETGTSTIPHFPKTITIPSTSSGGLPSDEQYTLLGLGIRTVSFLNIQVYVVGFYVQTNSLQALQSKLTHHINPTASALVAGEKTELKNALLDGEKSHQLWNMLLSDKDVNLKTAFRIVPTRNTDFGHLRDGWVRGITSRTQDAQKKGDSQFSDQSFGLAMKNFKDMMAGKGKAPTGSVLLLTRDSDGSLGLLYQDKNGKVENFGKLKDERIARLIWLGYLGGKNVSSEGTRKGVVNGVIDLVERPIGSVDAMVS